MQNYKVACFGLRYAKSVRSHISHSYSKERSSLRGFVFLLPCSGGKFSVTKRALSGYAVEQFSDDEYECDFEGNKVWLVLP